jgi:hypothetical protein
MRVQRFDESLDWLMNNAGPVIRYRTATELLHEEARAPALEKDLLASNLVRFWLGNLNTNPNRKTLHGARTETYENVMGKLFEFGLKRGNPTLDSRTKVFRSWLKQQIRLSNEGYLPVFHRTLTAAFLVMTGYADDEAVKEWVLRRLETVYAFAKKGSLGEAYVPQTSFPGFPKAFRNTPLMNPELYPDDELKLPWIHDMNAFLHSPSIMEDATSREKVEVVVRLILSPEYQRLHVGYGVVRHQSGRYYMMGWSVHLPAYSQPDVSAKNFGRLLLLLNLLGRSRTAKENSWHKHSIEILKRFKSKDDLISFPRKSLPEKRTGCWVLGHRMGLEENRRTQKAITCESTFRFLEIVSRNA